MFVVAFLCAIAVAPADCTRATAIDVIPMGESANELTCMMEGQMTLAGLALQADADHRWIVKCVRSSIGKTVG